MPAVAGKSFLEIGSGCGIVSVFAGLCGASLIVASDISPLAAANTKFNLDRLGLANTLVIQGNLFDAIAARFDVIFFNAPFYSSRATDWLESAVTDEDYKSVTAFLNGVRDHLVAGGCAVLGFSTSGDEQFLQTGICHAGLTVADVRGETRWGYNCRYYTLLA